MKRFALLGLIPAFFFASSCPAIQPVGPGVKPFDLSFPISIGVDSCPYIISSFPRDDTPQNHAAQLAAYGIFQRDSYIPPSETGTQFGSRKVLESCWSKEELEGHAFSDTGVGISIADKAGPVWDEITLPQPVAVPAGLGFSVRSVAPFHERKLVALTFDLCEAERERSGYDGDIVNLLRASRIHATFFAGGKWMRSHPREAMQLMADPLFEIGNHSWNHKNLATLDHDAAREQARRTQAQYAALRQHLAVQPCALSAGDEEMSRIPALPMLFRFPYGRCTRDSLRVLEEEGLVSIQWDVVSGDPSTQQTPERMVQQVLRQVKPGSIVVFHANGRGRHTARALPHIITGLQTRGYVFLTVSQLLASGHPVTSTECYEWRPGDNLRYDRPKERK